MRTAPPLVRELLALARRRFLKRPNPRIIETFKVAIWECAVEPGMLQLAFMTPAGPQDPDDPQSRFEMLTFSMLQAM